MNSQQLDHAFISPKLQRGAEVEHVHVNNWVKYNPSVSRVKLCAPCPPAPPPPPTCSTHQIGDWCIAQLPTFNTFNTCAYVHRSVDYATTHTLSPALPLWNAGKTAEHAIRHSLSPRTQCAGYQLHCARGSGYCAQCLSGTCGPSFS
jgi:hypothetical protein